MIDDAILVGTNPCLVSVDTANSKEVIAGSQITKQHTFKLCGSNHHKLLNVTTYEPREDDLSWNYDLDFLDYFSDWNILPNVNDTTNSGLNVTKATIVN